MESSRRSKARKAATANSALPASIVARLAGFGADARYFEASSGTHEAPKIHFSAYKQPAHCSRGAQRIALPRTVVVRGPAPPRWKIQ
jgi:hypothetical protein